MDQLEPRPLAARKHWQNSVFSSQAKGRQDFLDHGIPANQVTDHITILGHAFRGFRQRKLVNAEDEQINQSVAAICRIAYLPIAYSMRKRLIAAAPLAKG